MNEIIGQHALLLESGDRKTAEQHARYFFSRNELVRYDSLQIDANAIINATDPQFFKKIEEGLEGNRQAINNLVQELQAEGAADPQTWPTLQQGYASKLLHTAVHLLDGFFGADSALYNLVDNSHQVTDTLLKRITATPEKYWLVPVTGTSGEEEVDRVPMLRPFGREFEKT